MPYHILVLAREILDTRDLVGSPLDDAGAIRTSALATRYEPEDLNALEMALRIKESDGGKVTVLSVGPAGPLDAPREALYRGADAAVRIDAGTSLDTQATARLLAAAVGKIGAYDLLLAGVNISEGENSVLGAHLATLLGIEQISLVDAIDRIGNGVIVGKRAIEMGYEYIEAPLPALLSVGVALVADDPRTPRSAKAMLKLKHKKTDIPVWKPADLGIADVQALRTTALSRHWKIEEQKIQSLEVDPESESALKSMLDAVLKGA